MKRMKGRLLVILMSLAMAFTMMPMMGAPVYADDPAPAAPGIATGPNVLSIGSNTSGAATVHMAGTKWRVIGYGGEGVASSADTMTLIAADNLKTGVQFNPLWNLVNTYKDSNLYNEVNALTDDTNGIFSKGEKEGIVPRDFEPGDYTGSSPYTNGIAGDKVENALLWPLSTQEAYYMNSELCRASYSWWLRSPGFVDYNAAIVSNDGFLNYPGSSVDDDDIAVRPAFNFNLKSVIFTSAAVGGKSSGDVGAGSLTPVGTNTTGEWKVTVNDSVHSDFEVTETTSTENGVSVSYKGAATGTKEYISAIITDKPITDAYAAITYYGRIKNCTSDDDASGTVTINTAGKLGENDHLYIFNEQCNGDKKTDYASALQLVTIPKLITYTVTFEVKNGAWNDGTTKDKTVKLSRYDNEDKALVLQDEDIPKVGNKPNENYKAGSWDVTPNTDTTITSDTTYTYTYAKADPFYYTVTFVDGQGKTLKTEKVQSGKSATAPTAPKRSGYTFAGWDKDFSNVTSNMTVTAKWKKNAAQTVSGTLLMKMTAKGKTSLTIGWNKINGAAGYDIFFAECNHSGKTIVCKNVKTIKGNKTFKWTKTGLKKKTAYKAYVKAYVMKNGKKTYVRTSPMMHAYTGGQTKNYTNARSVTVKKNKVALKKGKTFKIKASVNKINKKKKLMPKSHAPTLRYMTSNKKIATVNSSGKITAKGKGTCYIYVLAHNGVSKQVKVTVK